MEHGLIPVKSTKQVSMATRVCLAFAVLALILLVVALSLFGCYMFALGWLILIGAGYCGAIHVLLTPAAMWDAFRLRRLSLFGIGVFGIYAICWTVIGLQLPEIYLTYIAPLTICGALLALNSITCALITLRRLDAQKPQPKLLGCGSHLPKIESSERVDARTMSDTT